MIEKVRLLAKAVWMVSVVDEAALFISAENEKEAVIVKIGDNSNL
jgi:hypothetical protein